MTKQDREHLTRCSDPTCETCLQIIASVETTTHMLSVDQLTLAADYRRVQSPEPCVIAPKVTLAARHGVAHVSDLYDSARVAKLLAKGWEIVRRWEVCLQHVCYAETCEREERAHQLVVSMLPGPRHTCSAGPVCPVWFDDMTFKPSSPYGLSEDEGCQHDSCWEILFGRCEPCLTADMADLAADLRKIMQDNKLAREGKCPTCLTRLEYVGEAGAPGIGKYYTCDMGHMLIKIGPDFCRPEHGPYELSIGDVI